MEGQIPMAHQARQADVRPLIPHREHRGANEHPVTAKVTNSAHDLLTGLAFVDQTNMAEQIRLALDYYFALRMQDQVGLAHKIAAERARHEAALAAITGGRKARPAPKVAPESAPAKTVDAGLARPVTLRIDSDTLDRLTAFSLVDEKTLAEVLRDAVDEYIVHRRLDPELNLKLDAAKQNVDRTLAVLAAGPGKSGAKKAPAARGEM